MQEQQNLQQQATDQQPNNVVIDRTDQPIEKKQSLSVADITVTDVQDIQQLDVTIKNLLDLICENGFAKTIGKVINHVALYSDVEQAQVLKSDLQDLDVLKDHIDQLEEDYIHIKYVQKTSKMINEHAKLKNQNKALEDMVRNLSENELEIEDVDEDFDLFKDWQVSPDPDVTPGVYPWDGGMTVPTMTKMEAEGRIIISPELEKAEQIDKSEPQMHALDNTEVCNLDSLVDYTETISNWTSEEMRSHGIHLMASKTKEINAHLNEGLIAYIATNAPDFGLNAEEHQAVWLDFYKDWQAAIEEGSVINAAGAAEQLYLQTKENYALYESVKKTLEARKEETVAEVKPAFEPGVINAADLGFYLDFINKHSFEKENLSVLKTISKITLANSAKEVGALFFQLGQAPYMNWMLRYGNDNELRSRWVDLGNKITSSDFPVTKSNQILIERITMQALKLFIQEFSKK